MDPHLAEAYGLVAEQHGAISRAQLLGAGWTPRILQRRLESGEWSELLPGVYGPAGHRATWTRRLWAAHLHAGPASAISHESAVRLQGFGQVRAGQVVLIQPDPRRHAPPDVRWHRMTDLAAVDVHHVAGLPVTRPARTAVDLAGTLGPASLKLLIEEGVVERRFTLSEVAVVLDRTRRQGKRGVRKLCEVLDLLGPGDGIPRSELERLLDPVLVLAELPAPLHEHPLPGLGDLVGFVDRCWPDARLIVEADGRKWHERRQQQLLDRERDLQAMEAGWVVVRLMWEHLAGDPRGTAERIRRIHDERIELLGR